ncbi:probable ATP-dependent RNA helicase CG8611 [Cylas formicarius]|uniref:probable ATP-dependent RNA helicase CG8611 n=1 Tax=Cylas formicarius TaxID=197179 RepID=UPI0029584D84|nr:probable ATP-dependent RNA helicase CG8611 [Cylas formicarius]
MTTFKFSWDKQDKPATHKVFARKRKTQDGQRSLKNKQNFKASDKVLSNVPQSLNRPISSNMEKRKSVKIGTKRTEIVFDRPNYEQKLIKRKGKKDKILKSTEEGNELEETTNQNKLHSLFSEKHKSIHVNTNVTGRALIENVFSVGMTFSKLDIHRHLASNLEKHSFKILTSIQEKAIPVVLRGKNALIKSQTGSGKTLVYAIPVLDYLIKLTPKIKRSDGLQSIIVVPSRELALQIHEVFNKLNTFQWIVVGHLCGGENRKTEKDRLRKGVHILIGTPGRLLDHVLHTAAFDAKNVQCLVLDEADRLLDMGFKQDISRLVEEIKNHKISKSYNPLALLKGQNRNIETPVTETDTTTNNIQTILLSATLSKGILELTNFLMKEHEYIETLEQSAVGRENLVIPETVRQEFLITFVKHRLVMLGALIVSKTKNVGKTFVFMATTQMVDFHYELFTKCLINMPKRGGKLKFGEVVLLDDFEWEEDDENEGLELQLFKLHGNMDQNQRKEVFNGFRKAEKGVLICTDVAARGLDVPEADCIIQYTAPVSNDDYIHRVGRTGRVGKSGSALIFLTHEEQEYINRLREHRVFLQEAKKDFLKDLSGLMMEPEEDKAILALQKRFELALSSDKQLHRKGCLAYSSWSRFYSTYPANMKTVFNFKNLNLGHYCTSFALQETPTMIAKRVKKAITAVEPKRLNKKLANHGDSEESSKASKKRPVKSLSLTTSEFSSGLEPVKKKRKKS